MYEEKRKDRDGSEEQEDYRWVLAGSNTSRRDADGCRRKDIQIAQRIIADVKALFTCVPYLTSASISTHLPARDPRRIREQRTHSYPIALGKQKSGAHHPKAPNVVLIAAASPPDGMDRK
jgi:hypothetical protein